MLGRRITEQRFLIVYFVHIVFILFFLLLGVDYLRGRFPAQASKQHQIACCCYQLIIHWQKQPEGVLFEDAPTVLLREITLKREREYYRKRQKENRKRQEKQKETERKQKETEKTERDRKIRKRQKENRDIQQDTAKNRERQ